MQLNKQNGYKMDIELLRLQLHHAFISQKMVAEEAGVHESYVSMVMNGKRYSDRVIDAAARLLKNRKQKGTYE